MKFDFKTLHNVFTEASEEADKIQAPDKTGSNLDNTLSQADLIDLFDSICPITGNVYASLKNAAADPDNLKIVASKDGEGEDAKLFIEATEFAIYCEATGTTIGEAADSIIRHYSEDNPALDNAEFHVVFPSDAVNKNVLGGENLGKSIADDWAMQLMRGCRRYGLKVNTASEGCCKESRSECL